MRDYRVVNEFGEVVGEVRNDIFTLYGGEMGFVSDVDTLRRYLWTLGLDLI